MGKNRKWMLLVVCFFVSIVSAHAQNKAEDLQKARLLVESKEMDKAVNAYELLYKNNPQDAAIYNEYFSTLLAAKNYKEAERLAESRLKGNPNAPLTYIDLGQVARLSGKEKKGVAFFDKALDYISGEDILTQQMAGSFIKYKNNLYAIRTYERAREMTRNPFMYYNNLSSLYAKEGETDKALSILLEAAPGIPGGSEELKATLLDITAGDAKKLQTTQKELIKRINQNPENTLYAELLTWIYTQKDDWEGALLQISAIDNRNKEHGQRIMEFSRNAAREKQFDIAIKALDDIAEMGVQEPLYALSKAQKLELSMQRLEYDAKLDTLFAGSLSAEYDSFFQQYPQFYASQALLDYARLQAQYNDRPQKAIAILQKAIGNPGSNKEFAGRAKLMMGDYQLITGAVWDASLTYSQVDKAFREDMLGEEARFRNAKLAYYRGDFSWAQTQLSVLKASTSELIANDALYLSVLITENITPDSNMVPLQRFAYADMLLFRNKNAEAVSLLDSIAKAFPKHPLNDDILLLRARLAEKQKDYPAALDYLKGIYVQYGKDVLGDDAVYKTAQIYELNIKDKEKAKHFYEQLIIDYPGSTYTQNARKKLQLLSDSSGTLP